jgi:hypothetical protein
MNRNLVRLAFSSPPAAFAAIAIGAGCLLSAMDAAAQPPPATTSPASSAVAATSARVPDVVKLKNGSMFRGVILELVANDHVELRLATGAVKRFPMSAVSFAGASDDVEPAPPAPLPTPPPPAPPHHEAAAPSSPQVQFDSDTPDTTVYMKDGESIGSGIVSTGRGVGTVTLRSKSYSRICGVPCDSTLESGTYQLAVAKGNGAPVEAEESVTIEGPSNVTAKYTDNSTTRTVGGVVIGTALVVGTVMGVEAFGSQQHCEAGVCASIGTLNGGLLGGGVAVAAIGSLVGLVLVLHRDDVTFSVTPWNGSTAFAPTAGVVRERARATPEGLALHVQF